MSLSEKYIKIKEFISEYYWIAGIPFLILGFTLAMESKEDINRNQKETYGMVYGSRPIYKQYSKRNYKYEFYYKGKRYTGTSSGYITENIENGNFYKVEFSDKKPEHNRINFDLEYVREIKTNENGKVDTAYVPKDQKLRNQINEQLEKFEVEMDSIKN